MNKSYPVPVLFMRSSELHSHVDPLARLLGVPSHCMPSVLSEPPRLRSVGARSTPSPSPDNFCTTGPPNNSSVHAISKQEPHLRTSLPVCLRLVTRTYALLPPFLPDTLEAIHGTISYKANGTETIRSWSASQSYRTIFKLKQTYAKLRMEQSVMPAFFFSWRHMPVRAPTTFLPHFTFTLSSLVVANPALNCALFHTQGRRAHPVVYVSPQRAFELAPASNLAASRRWRIGRDCGTSCLRSCELGARVRSISGVKSAPGGGREKALPGRLSG